MFFRSKHRRQQKQKVKKPLGARIRRWWRLLKVAVVFAVIIFIAGWYYLGVLDRQIEEKFDQPRKWNLPSRVFSDSEYLYPGLDTAKLKLVEKLDRLGYRNVGEKIEGPGDYAATSGQVDIYLHDFAYPSENFTGFPLRLELNEGKISEIINLESKDSLSVAKLEPEEISSIFDEKMEDRTVVTLKDVPETLLESIVLIEDERFFKHKGVDPYGIMRAAFANLRSLRLAQGGSTLTQQLVKNFFLYPKKSILRKIREMLMAIQIENHHSKAEILEAYINEIYLGQRGSSSVSGVAEASKYFFAKNVNQLTIGECALLAGMIRLPSAYNPLTHKEAAAERRNFVLKRLLDADLISKEEYTRAREEPIITPKVTIKAGRAPYFIDFVKQQLALLYPQEILQSEGLRIFTTLNMTMQIDAEAAVEKNLNELEKKYGNALPKDHAGQLQGALIAIQPNNGYLRALVGGRSFKDSQFNRATSANRQPGSAFKPFVYLTALDPRRSKTFFTPASTVEDTSFTIESGGKDWTPTNYDKKEHGKVTLRSALEESLNIATAKIAIDAGLDNIVDTAKEAGIESRIDPVPALSLGAFEVIPIELAAAYTIFPNGGILAQPISIMNVITDKGNVLEQKTVRMRRVFDAAPVYLTTNIMKGVIDRGTGASVRSLGFSGVAAGKTGTTSNYKDAWFVGFTPQLLALAWVGYDDNAVTNMSGGRAALPIWTDFMKTAAPVDSADFSIPSGVVMAKCNGFEEAFIEGTEKCSEEVEKEEY